MVSPKRPALSPRPNRTPALAGETRWAKAPEPRRPSRRAGRTAYKPIENRQRRRAMRRSPVVRASGCKTPIAHRSRQYRRCLRSIVYRRAIGRLGTTRTRRSHRDYDAYIRTEYGAEADAVLALYPATDYPVLSRALADITTDQRYTCPAREMARAASSSGAPAYLYNFVYDDWALGQALGAFHGSEIRFIFGTPVLGLPVSPEQAKCDFGTRSCRPLARLRSLRLPAEVTCGFFHRPPGRHIRHRKQRYLGMNAADRPRSRLPRKKTYTCRSFPLSE